jgi:hypothetical protein
MLFVALLIFGILGNFGIYSYNASAVTKMFFKVEDNSFNFKTQ